MAAAGLLLVVTGWILTPLEQAGTGRSRAAAEVGIDRPSGAVAEGVGATSGWRILAADLMWLSAYRAWEARDAERMRRRLQWVGWLDPVPATYWLNGARMLAYDVTAWRLANGSTAADSARSREIRDEQLQQARGHLEAARRSRPGRAVWWTEEAVLHLTLAGDRDAAREALVRAQACRDAPEWVARVLAGWEERGRLVAGRGGEGE